MAIALVVLAVGSVVAGYVGIPHALGGSNRFEQFLAPSLGETESHGETESSDSGTELALMGVSSAIAFAGIGIAAFLFLKRRDTANAIADRFSGLRRLLLHKYYIDEIYDAVIVQPIRLVSEDGLWKVLDAGAIDGSVNGVGTIVRGLSDGLRRLQTGSVRAYAASLFLGVVLVLGYYLWL